MKNQPVKNKGGRPSKFSREMQRQCKLMAKRGWTDVQMSEMLGIDEGTFNNWKKKHSKFFENIKNNPFVNFRTPKKRKRNPETTKNYAKKYYLKNKEKFKIAATKRESLRRGLVSDLKLNEWFEALRFFNYRCAYCGEKLSIEKEHIIPVSKGGGFTKKNIIPSCRPCNRSKTNLFLHEWYKYSSVYDTQRLLNIIEWIYGQKSRKEIEIRFRAA